MAGGGWLRLAGAELSKRMAMACRLRQETCRCVTASEAAVRVQDAWYMRHPLDRPSAVFPPRRPPAECPRTPRRPGGRGVVCAGPWCHLHTSPGQPGTGSRCPHVGGLFCGTGYAKAAARWVMGVGGWYQEAMAACFPTGGDFEFKPAFPSSMFECNVTYDQSWGLPAPKAVLGDCRITRAHCFLIIQRRSRPPSPNTAASGSSTISGPDAGRACSRQMLRSGS